MIRRCGGKAEEVSSMRHSEADMSLHATVKRKARTTKAVTRDKLPCGN